MTTQPPTPTPEQVAKSIRDVMERFFRGPQTSEFMYAALEAVERKAAHAIREACKAAEAERDALRARCEELEKTLAVAKACSFPPDIENQLDEALRVLHDPHSTSIEATVGRAIVAARNCFSQMEAEKEREWRMRTEAERSSRPVPPDHVRDDQQVDRRVLGTLAITADDVVVGHGPKLHHPQQPDAQSLEVDNSGAYFEEMGVDAMGEVTGEWLPVSKCYSTEAAAAKALAAEGAKEAGNG